VKIYSAIVERQKNKVIIGKTKTRQTGEGYEVAHQNDSTYTGKLGKYRVMTLGDK